jgi:hypothetical protein
MIFQIDMIAAVASGAAEAPLATSFTHTAPEYVQPGKRIIIKGAITDPAGIKLARCYFRAEAEADYAFVVMEAGADNGFTAVLPAAGDTTQTVRYRLLAVTNTGQIAKTSEFSTAVQPGAGTLPVWQTADRGTSLRVGIEVEPQGGVVAKIKGFNDDVTVDVAESTARFMAVSGAGVAIGMTGSAGSAGGAAAATTAGSGTILGLKASTFWWIVAGVAAVAVGGAVAAAGGGGGGGGKSTSSNTGSVMVRW